jgi:hypothetical protein
MRVVNITRPPPTTTAYLFWDGTYYYRVNLTARDSTAASAVPPVLGIGRKHVVDWAIALLLAITAAVGCLLFLQQVMGRNLKVIRPLYRYQRWFFEPMRYE